MLETLAQRGPNPRLAEIRRCLGTPTWESQGIMVYKGDCMDLLPALPPALIDLTVTSPPYNIGKEYEARVELEGYLSWCAAWSEEIRRITAPEGAFWLNLGYIDVPGRAKAMPIAYLLWARINFFLMQEIVWNYGAGVAARRMFSPRNEKWLWYVKNELDYVFNLDAIRDPDVKYPNQKKNGKIRVNPLGKNPTDVWQIPKVTTGAGRTGRRASPERTPHPAQFPEAVVERIILACSRPDGLVLDPFAGSGTTGVVAFAAGRPCVLLEKSARYIDIAIGRIALVMERGSVE
jgi:adenine-specific DNA-methyltransferase